MVNRRRIYFYEHDYLRDRQLDTIRYWPRDEVLNLERFEDRQGAQVPRSLALQGSLRPGWRQRVPLLNIKRRPRGLRADTIVYSWGAIIATGPFIVDLDSPYALTGYNLKAMPLFRRLLEWALGHPRCVEIRCMSKACREAVRVLFGDRIYGKAKVHYPCLHSSRRGGEGASASSRHCRFLFVGTQFEIKGGAALLSAFQRVQEQVPSARLDIVSHVPAAHREVITRCSGVTVHEATFTREEVRDRFLRQTDVLVHPTYVDSFPMVVLEAISEGVAVIATDVYAIREMVHDGVNGMLLQPPLSIWDGCMPSPYYYKLEKMPEIIGRTDTSTFEGQLARAMLDLALDPVRRRATKAASRDVFTAEFAARE
jgi:glycosyltransferase involved in cell wall biosynthesis